jgi:hypothetical protein
MTHSNSLSAVIGTETATDAFTAPVANELSFSAQLLDFGSASIPFISCPQDAARAAATGLGFIRFSR